jgi:hypothetical protein
VNSRGGHDHRGFLDPIEPHPVITRPYDRFLVAQAQIEGLPILTSDAQLKQYDLEVIGADQGDGPLDGHGTGRPEVLGACGSSQVGAPCFNRKPKNRKYP